MISTAQRAARPGFAVQLGGAPVQAVEKPQFGKSEALGILAAVVILLPHRSWRRWSVLA